MWCGRSVGVSGYTERGETSMNILRRSGRKSLVEVGACESFKEQVERGQVSIEESSPPRNDADSSSHCAPAVHLNHNGASNIISPRELWRKSTIRHRDRAGKFKAATGFESTMCSPLMVMSSLFSPAEHTNFEAARSVAGGRAATKPAQTPPAQSATSKQLTDSKTRRAGATTLSSEDITTFWDCC